MKKYGYIRVSTKEQNLDRQYEALLHQGIAPQNIFEDRLSGKDFNRPNYQRLLKRLKTGDVLVIKCIDRWEGITERSWSNGGLSVKRKRRTFIRQRQAEGIAIAKAKGVRFGRSRINPPTEFERYYVMCKEGKISLRMAAKSLNMSYTTFYRRYLEHGEDSAVV